MTTTLSLSGPDWQAPTPLPTGARFLVSHTQDELIEWCAFATDDPAPTLETLPAGHAVAGDDATRGQNGAAGDFSTDVTLYWRVRGGGSVNAVYTPIPA